MEADGRSASSSPSHPGSTMRSSRPRFLLDDRRPEPSPSPRKSERKRRRRAGPESAAVTARRPRALQDSASPSAAAARRPRAFQEAAALAVLAAGAPRAAPGSRSYGAVQRLWSDADEVALLTGAAAFRARNGHVPRLPDMAALFGYLRGSLSPHIDQDKVYYKLKRLKSKYEHAAPSAAAGKHELRVRDLCGKVWGARVGLSDEDDSPPEEEQARDRERRAVPDAAAMLPVATEVLDAYWKTNGLALSGVSLEKGLSLLATEDARSIETRWRQQLDAEVRSQMRRHDLAKDVYGLLLDAIKGLGP
ncbi:STOREKEEPER protein [Lolium perenne]|uniref:STOREKEEPER protein n=1 Tax=Lolium perenne TaxID=4522 RepID=UPI0021F59DD0|nr:STOREKEEPER protein-like [Lolium perenne]